jgi:hypothetical protein
MAEGGWASIGTSVDAVQAAHANPGAGAQQALYALADDGTEAPVHLARHCPPYERDMVAEHKGMNINEQKFTSVIEDAMDALQRNDI